MYPHSHYLKIVALQITSQDLSSQIEGDGENELEDIIILTRLSGENKCLCHAYSIKTGHSKVQ